MKAPTGIAIASAVLGANVALATPTLTKSDYEIATEQKFHESSSTPDIRQAGTAAQSPRTMPAFAQGPKERTIELKDGSTLIVFPDGKMGMTDRFNRPMAMTPGTPMETKDGKVVIMVGNEVYRKMEPKDFVFNP